MTNKETLEIAADGPWAIRRVWDEDSAQVISNDGQHLATVTQDPLIANANLIAAAPELLNALEALKEWGCTYTSPSVAVTIEPENSPHDLLVAAVEAINKAKEGQK
tara:strand:- start:1438 stop:1755 length:318 start_codon:yes stop_codon:yes gene_type:complete